MHQLPQTAVELPCATDYSSCRVQHSLQLDGDDLWSLSEGNVTVVERGTSQRCTRASWQTPKVSERRMWKSVAHIQSAYYAERILTAVCPTICVSHTSNSAVHRRVPYRQCSLETNYLILVRSQASVETVAKKRRKYVDWIFLRHSKLSHKQCKICLRQLFNTGCPLVPISIILNDLEQL